jgi:hypothetical protein
MYKIVNKVYINYLSYKQEKDYSFSFRDCNATSAKDAHRCGPCAFRDVSNSTAHSDERPRKCPYSSELLLMVVVTVRVQDYWNSSNSACQGPNTEIWQHFAFRFL